MSKEDDELVWSLSSGSRLRATRDMLMESTGEVCFVANREYVVSSMHPIANPPFVRVQDEQGHSHVLHPDDLRTHFHWGWKPQPVSHS